MLVYTQRIQDKTQADGVWSIGLSQEARTHQIATEGTSGTLAIKIKPVGKTAFEDLLDSAGAAVSINLAAPKALVFDAAIAALQVTPSGVSGTYAVALSGLS